jgi:hypothetical protein
MLDVSRHGNTQRDQNMINEYKDQRFRNLIGLVGPEFLSYVLNSTEAIKTNNSLRNHDFSKQQQLAIDQLADIVERSRVAAVQTQSTEQVDGDYLVSAHPETTMVLI